MVNAIYIDFKYKHSQKVLGHSEEGPRIAVMQKIFLLRILENQS